MADSPAHAFGQKLGEFLEMLTEYLLIPVAAKHGLYLDKKGTRPARGNLKKATWTDKYGNKHDLDYVLESGGSVTKLGSPIAFVEAAWRKGTRHSKNKVQEIQGAILPLVETNSHHAPFTGVILAGDFTAPSIQQLKNLNFQVLYFKTSMAAMAFRHVGLDITSSDTTPDNDYLAKIAAYNALTQDERFQVIEEIIKLHQQDVDGFIHALEKCLTRQITLVRVLPLHGVICDMTSIVEAIEFVKNYSTTSIDAPPLKFEVEIRYGNGDKIQATLSEKDAVLAFFQTYQPITASKNLYLVLLTSAFVVLARLASRKHLKSMQDLLSHFIRPFTCVDLFCGAGGLTEGFRAAGFTSAFAVDSDQQAVQTFRYNHPDTVCLHRDVRSLSGKEIFHAADLTPGSVDVLCGGPPCQGYSLAGLRIADDPKNHLFLDFVRLTKELQPKIVLFENVEGIKSMQSGNLVRAIFQEFERIGYCCEARILDAADYGVPQHRPRFILLAVPLGCTVMSFPQATHGTLNQRQQLHLFENTPLPHITAWEALSDLPSIGAGEGAEELVHSGEYYNSYQRDRQGSRFPGMIFNHRAINHCNLVQARYAQIPEGGDNQLLPVELRTKKRNVWKLNREKPSRTVTCNHRTDIIHPVLPRGTTVREAARLQSFDDDYRFFGNLTRKAKWVTQDDQVGNAVPPLLAHALALQIKNELTKVPIRSGLEKEACRLNLLFNE